MTPVTYEADILLFGNPLYTYEPWADEQHRFNPTNGHGSGGQGGYDGEHWPTKFGHGVPLTNYPMHRVFIGDGVGTNPLASWMDRGDR